jgi:hypothetical protein
MQLSLYYLPMQIFQKIIAAGVAFCLFTAFAPAQNSSPTDRLYAAHGLYYTPTVNGLRSFQCSVSMDWKDLLTRITGQTVPDDNAFLVYLQSTQFSVTDDLKGDGSLHWTDTAPLPKDAADAISQFRDGLNQTLGGYFKTWNAYMNGSMVPLPDKTVTVTQSGDGVALHGNAGNMVLDETFDKNLLLNSVHVVSTDYDILASPGYTETQDGLIITSIHNVIHQPPGAAASEMTFAISYARTGSYQLPSVLKMDIKNVATLNFKFSGCTINPAAPAASSVTSGK